MNAKELLLSKINAGKELAGTYIHLLLQGVSFKDISNFMVSNTIDKVLEHSKPNVFTNSSGSIDSGCRFYLEGPNIKNYLNPYLMQKIMSAYYGSKSKTGPDLTTNKLLIESINTDIYKMSSHNNFIANMFEFKGISETVKYKGLILSALSNGDKGVYMVLSRYFDDCHLRAVDIIHNGVNLDKVKEFHRIYKQADETRTLGGRLGINQGMKTDFYGLYNFNQNLDGLITDRINKVINDFSKAYDEYIKSELSEIVYKDGKGAVEKLKNISPFNLDKLEKELLKIYNRHEGRENVIAANAMGFTTDSLHKYLDLTPAEYKYELAYNEMYKLLKSIGKAVDVDYSKMLKMFGVTPRAAISQTLGLNTIYDVIQNLLQFSKVQKNAIHELKKHIASDLSAYKIQNAYNPKYANPQFENNFKNLYNTVKSKFNILDIEFNSPHYRLMIQAASTADVMFADAALRHRTVLKVLNDLKTEGFVDHTHKYNEDQIKAILSHIGLAVVNKFFNKNTITVQIGKGDYYYDESLNLHKSKGVTTIDLNTVQGRAAFKEYVENNIEALKKKHPGNKFLENITYDIAKDKVYGHEYKFLKPSLNMTSIKADYEVNLFQDMVTGFDLLSQSRNGNIFMDGLVATDADLFFLYNMIVNGNAGGRNTFTKIFENNIDLQSNNILMKYLKFVGDLDAENLTNLGVKQSLDYELSTIAKLIAKPLGDRQGNNGEFVRIYDPELKRLILHKWDGSTETYIPLEVPGNNIPSSISSFANTDVSANPVYNSSQEVLKLLIDLYNNFDVLITTDC